MGSFCFEKGRQFFFSQCNWRYLKTSVVETRLALIMPIHEPKCQKACHKRLGQFLLILVLWFIFFIKYGFLFVFKIYFLWGQRYMTDIRFISAFSVFILFPLFSDFFFYKIKSRFIVMNTIIHSKSFKMMIFPGISRNLKISYNSFCYILQNILSKQRFG